MYPCNWSVWKALNAVCGEWEDVISLNLPEHFMREMFLAVMCLELHWCGEALSRMEDLSDTFPRSRFLILKAACAHYNSRKMDEAQARPPCMAARHLVVRPDNTAAGSIAISGFRTDREIPNIWDYFLGLDQRSLRDCGKH